MKQCKEKRIRIELKNTKDEFIARVGFLLGPATNWASALQYEYLIIKNYKISPMNFEIKKEQVYKRKYKVKVLVIYTILSQREVVDKMVKDL